MLVLYEMVKEFREGGREGRRREGGGRKKGGREGRRRERRKKGGRKGGVTYPSFLTMDPNDTIPSA